MTWIDWAKATFKDAVVVFGSGQLGLGVFAFWYGIFHHYGLALPPERIQLIMVNLIFLFGMFIGYQTLVKDE